MADVQTLVDMGFSRDKVEYAIKVTNNGGVEPAMEWLLAHADEKIPDTESVDRPNVDTTSNVPNTDDELTASTSSTAAAAAAVQADAANSAKSLKCDVCGKLCSTQTDVEYHATKSGHQNFSESTEEKKPLTDDERKEQLALIEEKLKQKRLERQESEKADALERERLRIKSGKDITEARKRMEELEMQKIVDQRKREKAEEKAARDRVRAQIESDKAARKDREAKQTVSPGGSASGGGGGGGPSAASSTTTTATASTAAAAAAADVVESAAAVTSTTGTSPTHPSSPPSSSESKTGRKEYSQTRIQIRLQDGSALTEVFNVKEQLSAVRVFIQMKNGDDLPFRLMTAFPRKVFNDEDYEKPLEVLGLVPSAVLIVCK